jgi:maltose alpha-D-glucosyltransferase / alpha-amylase
MRRPTALRIALSLTCKSARERETGSKSPRVGHSAFEVSDGDTSVWSVAYGYEQINVAKQRRDPSSMLNWTERIIRMRKEVPEIGWGDLCVIATRDPAILAIRYDWRNTSVLFVHNLGRKAARRFILGWTFR